MSSRARAVRLGVREAHPGQGRGPVLEVWLNEEGPGAAEERLLRSEAARDIEFSESMCHGPNLLRFSDGAFVEIREGADGERIRAALAQRSWRVAAASALGAVAFLVSGYLYGLLWLSGGIAPQVPEPAARSLGDAVLRSLQESGLLAASRLTPERQEEIRQALRRIDPGGLVHRLEFRGWRIGPNAFAMPCGMIIVTDDLAKLAEGNEAGLQGVLAHELGHVEPHHGMQMLIRASILGGFSAWLFGDISGLLAAGSAAVLSAHYSREQEREADARALALMRRKGLPPERFADLLEQLACGSKACAPGELER
ncbi:MAG: M48 family metallopeptidase [Candidatus Protistobacter heckmanni]|nr:M48 family metallopeptidase [Candidatus Protistobacter heckmanni]